MNVPQIKKGVESINDSTPLLYEAILDICSEDRDLG